MQFERVWNEQNEFIQVIKDFYKEMLVIDDVQVRWNAFYNFPYFYSEFWNELPFK
jgi:hypothetical protein